MASRGGIGVGVWVTISILTVLTVTLFVLTLVFYGQKSQATRDLDALRAEIPQYIRDGERAEARVGALLDEARRENVSLVSLLIAERRAFSALASGTEELSSREARERAAQTTEGEIGGASLLGYVTQLRRNLVQARAERDNAQAAARAAIEDQNAEIQRLRRTEQGIAGAIDAANTRVTVAFSEVQRNREGLDRIESRLNLDREEDRARFLEQVRGLEGQVASLTAENLQLAAINRELRGVGTQAASGARDEAALVDGAVIAVDPVNNEAVISLGRSDRLSIGQTFSVYASSAELRPDAATGEFRPGKAVLEVIQVDRVSSRCRIISQRRNSAVVAGDVIVNPLYDPKKIYRFVVYGEFDTNNDGAATAGEELRLRALINEWGGQVTEDIDGALDFVVLGRRPVVPPQPPIDAPQAVVDQWARLNGRARRFDQLFERASNASIPVLNYNRLITLIGEVPN